MTASLVLTLAAILSGAIYIWTTQAGTQRQRYIFKPLTTLLILLVALTLPEPISAMYQMLIAAGIVFSIAGDIFLMLPSNTFVWGLASFLIAHLFFIGAFVSRSGVQFDWLLLLPFLLYGVLLVALLWPYVGSLRIPVIAYAVVLLVMGWQATEVWWATRGTSALLGMVGAISFIASDSILAMDKFRAPIARRDFWIMTTYYGAVLLLAWSVRQF